MSSTLSPSKAATASDAVARPIPEHDEVHVGHEQDERDFAGFVRAIGMGIAVGVPAVALIIAGIVRIAAPDVAAAGVLAIAVWVAIWIGVFLGGTVTVGLWSAKQHGAH